jgi:hypothetical protein
MPDRRDLGAGWLALLVTAALQLLLPEALSAGPSWVAVALVALLASAGLVCPNREPWLGLHHALAYLSLVLVTGALAYSMVVLVGALLYHRGAPAGLLGSAALLWASNVFVFATWYWRLDRGGPHQRSKQDFHNAGAFLFPQMTMSEHERHAHGLTRWRPAFVDYLFLAFNTSTAFSPTDVPVLSRWAKLLMMLQSAISLATLALLAARAVNVL